MGVKARLRALELRTSATNIARQRRFEQARDEYIGGLRDQLVRNAYSFRRARERAALSGKPLDYSPERLGRFQQIALALSYLGEDAEPPEHIRQMLEDTLAGVEPEVGDIVPEDEREDVSRAFAKLFRIVAVLAHQRLAQALGVEVQDLLKEQEGLDDGGK